MKNVFSKQLKIAMQKNKVTQSLLAKSSNISEEFMKLLEKLD